MTHAAPRVLNILMADDDADDRVLVREAFEESRLSVSLSFAEDGQDLLDALRRPDGPRPDLVLMDLNMPRCNGLEALAAIRADARLRQLPVVMLTTSSASADIQRAYEIGANSYCIKPVSYEKLVEMTQTLTHFWLETAELPHA